MQYAVKQASSRHIYNQSRRLCVRVYCVEIAEATHPTDLSTILQLQNPPIDEIYEVQKRRLADFETLYLYKERSGRGRVAADGECGP